MLFVIPFKHSSGLLVYYIRCGTELTGNVCEDLEHHLLELQAMKICLYSFILYLLLSFSVLFSTDTGILRLLRGCFSCKMYATCVFFILDTDNTCMY